MKGLEGVRVIELGEMVSAAYAAKLLADLGAEVIKVEPPGGDRARFRGPFPGGVCDPERSGLFLYLNNNKRSVVLDLATGHGRDELDALVGESDLLVHNLPLPRLEALGVDYVHFSRLRPALVMCSITPFGLSGPYSRYRAEEITTAHGGGWAWLSPGALERPELPPLKAFGHQADFQGGVAGATAALGAIHRAQRTGIGEHIDVSVQAYVASYLEQAVPYYTYMGLVASRLGQRLLNPWKIFECADGLIFLCTIEEDQWARLKDFMGRPEWAEMELFADAIARNANADALNLFLQEWIGQWKVEELFHEGQSRRICFAPVFDMATLAEHPHLHARRVFVDVTYPRAGTLRQPGPPFQLTEPWWQIRRPAPLLGEHDGELLGRATDRALPSAVPDSKPSAAAPTAAPLPLAGIRVADFTWVWAGPFCTMHLAHLGAEVIKIESAARPDIGRRVPIVPPGVPQTLNTSGYFNQWGQGKKSIRLHLSKPAAVEAARRLIAQSDVVVDNFAHGVMERLGLSPAKLFEIKPDLVIASISGYGATGPLASYMGYGPSMAPLGGLSSLTGYAGDSPRELGISYGDPNAGIHAAMAICAALVARQRTGRGQRIDLSLWEAMAAVVAEGFMEFAMNGVQPERRGNRDPLMAPHNCYRCAGEDRWVTIACASEAEWRALAGVIDPALLADSRFADAAARKRHEDALDARIEAWTRTRDRWEVTRALQAVGAAAFPSLSPEDLANDPHLDARGFLARLPHAEVGTRIHAGIPWLLERSPNSIRSAAPLLGAHTHAVLRELCGYSAEEIAALERDGVLY
ncbi:MAG: CaiB/BaiF CoA transferase family protein [Candidatus Binatia bacterium]